jgi:hypothetical protein
MYFIEESLRSMMSMIKNPLAEIDAMKTIAEALGPLEPEAQTRILRWAADVFRGLSGSAIASVQLTSGSDRLQGTEKLRVGDAPILGGGATPTFGSIADLFAAATPAKDSERALVVGYWFQILQGEPDLDSHMINKELKHLGHGVANITQTLNSLINKKPQLAIQTRKSGGSQQARKRYKITSAGQQVVERMLNKIE